MLENFMWLIFRIFLVLVNNRWNLKETKKKIEVCTYKNKWYIYCKTYKSETRSIQKKFKIHDWECSLHGNNKCYIVRLYHHKSSPLVLYQMFLLSLCHIYYMEILWTFLDCSSANFKNSSTPSLYSFSVLHITNLQVI